MKTILAKNNWLSELDDLFLRENNTSNFNWPATNITESENSFELNLIAPGFEKSDFKIETEKDVLQIVAERSEGFIDEETKITRQEFTLRNFTRSFKLPENIEIDEISAKYETGILKIQLPKKKQELFQTKKMIDIL